MEDPTRQDLENFIEHAIKGDELHMGRPDEFGAEMKAVYDTVKQFVHDKKVFFVTTPSYKESAVDKLALYGFNELSDASFVLQVSRSLNCGSRKAVFTADFSKIRIPLEMNEVTMKEKIERFLAEDRKRVTGGFAKPQYEHDVRSRSERRGHKPKKQLKGQDYLALRGKF